MKKIKTEIRGYKIFCWAGFLVTLLAGLLLLIAPTVISKLLGIKVPEDSTLDPFFIRFLGVVLIPYAFLYLLSLIDSQASRSLLVGVTSEKFLAVLFLLGSLFAKKVGFLGWGMVVLDGALLLVGVYMIIALSRWVVVEEEGVKEESSSS